MRWITTLDRYSKGKLNVIHTEHHTSRLEKDYLNGQSQTGKDNNPQVEATAHNGNEEVVSKAEEFQPQCNALAGGTIEYYHRKWATSLFFSNLVARG